MAPDPKPHHGFDTLKLTLCLIALFLAQNILGVLTTDAGTYAFGAAIGGAILPTICAVGLWSGIRGAWWGTLAILSLRLLGETAALLKGVEILAQEPDGPLAVRTACFGFALMVAPLAGALITMLLPETRRLFNKRKKTRNARQNETNALPENPEKARTAR